MEVAETFTVPTAVSEQFMLCFVKLLAAIFTGEVLIYTPWPPCFHRCNVIFSCQPFALTAWVWVSGQQWLLKKQERYLAEKSHFGCCWTQELQIVPGSCRFDTLECNFPCLDRIFSGPHYSSVFFIRLDSLHDFHCSENLIIFPVSVVYFLMCTVV